MASVDCTSYVTVWPARTCTRAPAAGTLPPSQVAGNDQQPLRAERISGAAFPAPSADAAASSVEHSDSRQERTSAVLAMAAIPLSAKAPAVGVHCLIRSQVVR